MTKIKLCGLTRPCDIAAANELLPEYIGLVFTAQSRRYIAPDEAARLKSQLHPDIAAVGVFVNAAPEAVAELLERGVIDIAQLHGSEDAAYISRLRALTAKPIIQAFRIDTAEDIERARSSTADSILLDSAGGGSGTRFDWRLIQRLDRPYFLAGGLDSSNIRRAITMLRPYAVDVSSGIETAGVKDKDKMGALIRAVRSISEPEATEEE